MTRKKVNRLHCVYGVLYKPTLDFLYVGRSINFFERRNSHLNQKRNNINGWHGLLYEHLDDIEWIILLLIKEDSIDLLLPLEIYWIRKLLPLYTNEKNLKGGYNDNSRPKASLTMKEKYKDPEEHRRRSESVKKTLLEKLKK